MSRMWKRVAEILITGAKKEPAIASVEHAPYADLPYIDNETLDHFLSEPANVELLPVDPYEYRPEIQRMIVSAFFHEASIRAKEVQLN